MLSALNCFTMIIYLHHTRPSRPILSLLLIITVLLLHSTATTATRTAPTAQSPPLKQLYNISKNFKQWDGHIKAFLSNSPTTMALRANRTLVASLSPLYDLIDNFTDIIEDRIDEQSPLACSLRLNSKWVSSSQTRVKVFQLGVLDNSCLSFLDGQQAVRAGILPSSLFSSVKTILRNGRRAFFEATLQSSLPDILRFTLAWDRLYSLSGFMFQHRQQVCHTEYIFAYRVLGKWFVRHAVTNHAIDHIVTLWDRNYTHEYISRDLQTLSLVHERFDNNVLINASTLLVSWSGIPGPGSVWTNYYTDHEQALAQALDQNAVSIDLAADGITASNTAVLALPMVMSFVPVAFIADLDSCGMLIYALMTDVFAAIPFLVKGIELVLSARNRKSTMHAFYMGNETLGQMEINAAECVGTGGFGVHGWYFIVVAMCMMVTGVVMEVVAAHVMARRRAASVLTGQIGGEVKGPFGDAVFTRTGGGFLGARLRRAEKHFWRSGIAKGLRARRKDDDDVGGVGVAQACEKWYDEVEEVDEDQDYDAKASMLV